MKHLTITITGETETDLVIALEEVKSQVEKEFTSGFDRNETGSYTFELEERPAS